MVSEYPFWQLSIDHNMDIHKDVHYQVKQRLYMPWTPWTTIARSLQENYYKETANESARSIIAV